jgi:hypothetical protein
VLIPVYAKLHSRAKPNGATEEVLALCDRNLLGKVLKQGNAVLDLKAYAAFYEGAVVGEKEAIELIRGARNLNLVGEKSLKAAEKAIGVKAGSAKRIAGVPHLQVYCI